MAKVDYAKAVQRGDARAEAATMKRQHPTLSDVALALATRRSDPLNKVELSLNAKGDVQISVDVTDPDPATAAKQASALFDVLRAKYPRENGATT